MFKKRITDLMLDQPNKFDGHFAKNLRLSKDTRVYFKVNTDQ